MNAPLRHPIAVQPRRIAPLARLPLFFALGGKRAVVAGGNAAAAWKAELLAAAGALVEVYAVSPCEGLDGLMRDRGMRLIRRPWTPRDLKDAALAIGAFDDDDDAAAFASAARAVGVPVNVIDKPACCDFSFGAIVNRSPLVVGISTDGASPALAQAIRGRIEAVLPERFARWIAAAAGWRARVKALALAFEQRRRFWQFFTDRALAPGSDPSEEDFEALMAEAAEKQGHAPQGGITLIEVTPETPDLLTLRAVRALQLADVIAYDEEVGPDILDYARREASRIVLSRGESDTDRLLAEQAKDGRRVVLLKSPKGDF